MTYILNETFSFRCDNFITKTSSKKISYCTVLELSDLEYMSNVFNIVSFELHCLSFQTYLNLLNQGRLLRQNEFYAMDSARRRRQLMRIFLFDKLVLITAVYRKVSA